LLAEPGEIGLRRRQFATQPHGFGGRFGQRRELPAELGQLLATLALVTFEPLDLRSQMGGLLGRHFQPLLVLFALALQVGDTFRGLREFGRLGLELFLEGLVAVGRFVFSSRPLGNLAFAFGQAAAGFGQLPSTVGQLRSTLLAVGQSLFQTLRHRLIAAPQLPDRFLQRTSDGVQR
jgi:hypothetical protein